MAHLLTIIKLGKMEKKAMLMEAILKPAQNTMNTF
jgi:hypothetical protein